MNFGRLGLVIVKGFNNTDEVNHYRQVMSTNNNLTLPAHVRPIVISVENFDILLRDGRSFEEYFNFVEEKTYTDTEESVLPPEEFGESEGIPTDSPEEYEDETSTPIEETIIETPEVIEPSTDVETDVDDNTEEETPTTPEPAVEAAPVEPIETPAKPELPEYPTGSEGDDSLFEDEI